MYGYLISRWALHLFVVHPCMAAHHELSPVAAMCTGGQRRLVVTGAQPPRARGWDVGDRTWTTCSLRFQFALLVGRINAAVLDAGLAAHVGAQPDPRELVGRLGTSHNLLWPPVCGSPRGKQNPTKHPPVLKNMCRSRSAYIVDGLGQGRGASG